MEIQYQKILEKITDKMMSKRLSLFKRELLIRIALNLESMELPDLVMLEKLLDNYEANDPEIRQMDHRFVPGQVRH